MTPEEIVKNLAPVIRDFVEQESKSLRDEITELKSLIASIPKPERGERGDPGERGEVGQKGPDGSDGKDGIGLAGAMLDKDGSLAVTMTNGNIVNLGRVVGKDGEKGEPGEKGDRGEAGEAGQKGEPGEKGEAGKDADIGELREFVESALADRKDIDPEFIKALMPKPLAGEKGEPGEKGDSVTVDDVAPLIGDLVAKAVSEIPAPQSGKDGKDADEDAIFDRIEARIGDYVKTIPKAENGKDGKDGRGIKSLHVNHAGELIAVFTDDVEKNCGKVAGPQGEAGADGRDGFGFDDFRTEFDGERRLTIIWEKGEARREKEIIFPIQISRGVYESGSQYERGDVVTYGGSQLTAMSEIKGKPGAKDSGWQLSVKKGRDGKDGKGGDRGEKGDPGRPGRDLTQIDPSTGEKW